MDHLVTCCKLVYSLLKILLELKSVHSVFAHSGSVHTSCCCRAEPNRKNYVRQHHGSSTTYESSLIDQVPALPC